MGKVLYRHRIYLLCGANGGDELLSALKVLFNGEMMPDEKREEFQKQIYTRRDIYEEISEFKRILNYFVSYDFREQLIDLVAHKLN